MAGGSFVVSAHLLVLASGLGGAASPVIRPREHNRISCPVVDMGEMRAGRRWIVAVTQRDPARHEMEFRSVRRRARSRALSCPFGSLSLAFSCRSYRARYLPALQTIRLTVSRTRKNGRRRRWVKNGSGPV